MGLNVAAINNFVSNISDNSCCGHKCGPGILPFDCTFSISNDCKCECKLCKKNRNGVCICQALEK